MFWIHAGTLRGLFLRKRFRSAWKKAPRDSPLEQAFIKDGEAVNIDDSMQDILPLVASHSWPVPVVDDDNVYKGVVSKNRFLKTLHRAEENLDEQAEGRDRMKSGLIEFILNEQPKQNGNRLCFKIQ